MEDIFDEMRRFFENQFKGLFPENRSENKPEELKTDQNELKADPHDNPFTKSYSISYRFAPGMDKPEIKVNGNLDKEILNNMLPNFNNFNGMLNFSAPDIIEPEKPKTKKKTPGIDYEEPFTDVLENEAGADIVLEMAGVVIEDIRIAHADEKTIITAETPFKKYRAEIQLGFKPLPDPKILSNNGIITIEFRK